MNQTLHKLFFEWDLGTWANILEIVGFTGTIVTLLISLSVRSKLNKLKTSYLLEHRIKNHIDNLTTFTTSVNMLINDYDNNALALKKELALLQPELEDIAGKLNKAQSAKVVGLIRMVKLKRKNRFVNTDEHIAYSKRLPDFFLNYFITSVDDIYEIYHRVHEIIIQLKNIKSNNRSTLK